MKSPFGRKAVPASTITELKARGTSAGIAWNAKKFPWVVLTSLCSECARGGAYTELSGKGPNYTLDQGAIGGATGANIFASAGLSTVVNVLGTQRPAPTIESVEVKKQGELGTTRKVIVNIKAYTDLQLIGLQKCFFIPQMGVRVQWGWSHSIATAISGNPPPITTITNRKLSDADAICQMKKLEKANPNYSGLQGIVANFSYNLTTENYWDCSIEIIAATEALSGAKVNTYNCGCKRESEVEDESGSKQKVVRVESDIIAHLRDLQDKFPEGYAAYNSTLSGYSRRVSIAQYYFKQTKQRNESGQISRSWGQAIQDFFTWSAESYEAFISWGALEALINYLVMDLGKDGGGSSKKWLGRISSSDVELSYHPAVASGDPYVCLVPGGQFQDTIATYKQGDNPPSAISGNKVLLGNIMINVIFLIGELRAVETGEGSLISFLNTILSRISESCGGLWALEAVSTTESCDSTKDAPTITVIDIKPYEAAAAFSIPSSPNNSCVRDMKLDMKMTDAMKTQALYSGGPIAKTKSPSGGNCDGDAFRAFNAAGTKAYNLAKDQRTSDVASSDCGTSNTGALQKTADTSYDALFKKLADNGPKSSIISACKSVLIEAYSLTAGGFSGWRGTSGPSSNSGGRRDHCTGVPLPFEFSFTVDGIGGFEFGQMVTSDRIPDEIKANFEWQVTSVEHSITSQDWTTTVNTICRFKNN